MSVCFSPRKVLCDTRVRCLTACQRLCSPIAFWISELASDGTRRPAAAAGPAAATPLYDADSEQTWPERQTVGTHRCRTPVILHVTAKDSDEPRLYLWTARQATRNRSTGTWVDACRASSAKGVVCLAVTPRMRPPTPLPATKGHKHLSVTVSN